MGLWWCPHFHLPWTSLVAFAAKVYVVPLTELLQVVHVSLEWDLLQINCRLQPWDLLGADGVGTPET